MNTVSHIQIAMLLAGSLVGAQDQCKPVGWATRDGRTGGALAVTGGGNATPIVVTTFADLQKYAKDDQPRVLYIDGTLGSGWKGQSGDRLKITGSNKTIVGLRPGTRLNAVIRITEGARNIIVRNIVIQGPGSDTTQGWDNFNITSESPDVVGPRNIWIDHCEFWDGQDGNADVVLGADNVTFTWCIFGYRTSGVHNLSNLIASGNSETISEGRLDITFMNNWWYGASQRQPRCRYGNVHLVNNLLSRNPDLPRAATDYGMAAGKNCQILVENNYFSGIQEPFSDQFKEGTSGLESSGNIFDGTTGNQLGWGSVFKPPYEYKSTMVEAAKVKDLVQRNAGANLASPSTCPSGATSILPHASVGFAGRIVPSPRELRIEGFEGVPLLLEIVSVSGGIRFQRTFAPTVTDRSVDLSQARLIPGLYLAIVKANGRTAKPVTFLIQSAS